MKSINLKREDGQSLVEVVVALSVLTIVLTGVVTLAVNTVALMITSRMKTEATAYAQQGIESLKGDVGASCGALENTPGAGEENFPTSPTSTYSRTKRIEDPPVSLGLPATYASTHALVIIKVNWENKGQDESLIVKQVMKRQ